MWHRPSHARAVATDIQRHTYKLPTVGSKTGEPLDDRLIDAPSVL
ncbi:hypothetical protein AB0D04_32930 [Streptomyces sp. NPDC048483]